MDEKEALKIAGMVLSVALIAIGVISVIDAVQTPEVQFLQSFLSGVVIGIGVSNLLD